MNTFRDHPYGLYHPFPHDRNLVTRCRFLAPGISGTQPIIPLCLCQHLSAFEGQAGGRQEGATKIGSISLELPRELGSSLHPTVSRTGLLSLEFERFAPPRYIGRSTRCGTRGAEVSRAH